MRRIIIVLALCAGCRDQRAACRAAIEGVYLHDQDAWIERCVREAWSDAKMKCIARTGYGTFLSMSCE
ncbi:MAG TPA: hypothetical protein VK427_26390 [Kofleriaceae bacterium]|nr:hypothetical protein [Kofleriaceae bacterium]